MVSGDEKLNNPYHRIYGFLLERNGLDAQDCIFIDDSQDNIKAAREVGFSTIHFSPETKLAEELEALGVDNIGRAS
ncbi:MAG: HAD-IA family hydrolase [Pseudomonadota bacterium]